MTIPHALAPVPDVEAPLDWSAIESGPSILPEQARASEEPVAPFDADEWPLAALAHGGKAVTLVWHDRRVEAKAKAREATPVTWPEHLLRQFKRAAWLLINKPTPHSLMGASKSKRRPHTAPVSIQAIAYRWRPFAAWLDKEGVSSLDAVTTDLLDLYLEWLQAPGRGLAPRTVDQYRRSLIDLWARGPMLPEGDRIEEPSWSDNGRLRTTGTRTAAENSTLIVSPSTMEPLLAWILTMLDLAPDIIGAGDEYVSMMRRGEGESEGATRRLRRDASATDFARQIIRAEYPPGTPVPGSTDWRTPTLPDFPASYLAAAHGRGRLDRLHVRWAMAKERPDWRNALDDAIPLPMTMNPQGRIADQTWREHIDYREVPALITHLRTASLLAITYLSGMRGQESRQLKTGCGVEVPAADGAADYAIRGRIWKGVVDKDGRQDPEGRPHTWVTVKPGYDALSIAERIRTWTRYAAETDYLFSTGPSGGAITPTTAADWIDEFVGWANAQVDALGLPEQLRIPDCIGGPVRLARLRRTLAWHIRHRPDGHVALAIQYGHVNPAGFLDTETGEGYSGRKASGLADVLDEETRSALGSATAFARDEVMAGGGVSGLGAERALDIARGTPMGKLSAREEKELLKEKDRGVFFNPRAFALCINDPDKAACRKDMEPGPPLAYRCVGKKCANMVRTDATVQEMASEAVRLRNEADFSPGPLADRLIGHAEEHERDVEEHVRTRRTLTRPAGEESAEE
ncbi:hypothetical protein DQ240_08730 [Blastococcus sp. TF02A-26]|nr:hypothetical protein DQ240_08700 [Blastococcus sp. TF02A-26]RBY86873.1 hypothetical protein DQ240_08730 [Blastococcus sp. TF02A-26]